MLLRSSWQCSNGAITRTIPAHTPLNVLQVIRAYRRELPANFGSSAMAAFFFECKSSKLVSGAPPFMESQRMANEIIHNVDDRRHSWVGSWEIEPLDVT